MQKKYFKQWFEYNKKSNTFIFCTNFYVIPDKNLCSSEICINEFRDSIYKFISHGKSTKIPKQETFKKEILLFFTVHYDVKTKKGNHFINEIEFGLRDLEMYINNLLFKNITAEQTNNARSNNENAH